MSNQKQTEKKNSVALFGQNDLPSLSPFRWDATFEITTENRIGKSGTPYEMQTVGILPMHATPNAGTFHVQAFKSIVRQIKALQSMNPDSYLVASWTEPKDNGYRDLIISVMNVIGGSPRGEDNDDEESDGDDDDDGEDED